MHQVHVFIEVVKVFSHAADLFHPPGTGAQFSRKQQSDFFESADSQFIKNFEIDSFIFLPAQEGSRAEFGPGGGNVACVFPPAEYVGAGRHKHAVGKPRP